jgi:CubicO group peptidase (beta-lactamase class C family)
MGHDRCKGWLTLAFLFVACSAPPPGGAGAGEAQPSAASDASDAPGEPGAGEADAGPGPGALVVPPPKDVNVRCDELWQDRVNHGRYWYEDNPQLVEKADTTGWVTATPESQGVDDAGLERGLTWLGDGCGDLECSFLQSALVVRHGKLVKERYFHGATATRANNVHSASKSILSALVGIAIREKFIASIDDPICKYLGAEWPDVCTGDKARITIKDLLTMRSGIAWTEDESEYEVERLEDWSKQLLRRPQAHPPGATFEYSTANTHLMSKLLTVASKMSTCELGHRYLLAHLGIGAEHWASDDKGVFFGGCNVYLTPRELARFGAVVVARGVHDGLQIIPEQWVAASLENHVKAVDPEREQTHDYGYWYWNRSIAGHPVKKAWGHAGQMIYVVPDLDLVVVNTTTTREGEEERDIDFDEWLERFVLPAVTR